MHHITFIGACVPDKVASDLFDLDPMPAIQTHKFGWAFVDSLHKTNNEVSILSFCPIQNFPKARKLIFKRFEFVNHNGIKGVCIGYINIIILRHLTRFIAYLFETKLVLKSWKTNIVFIHGLHSPCLFYALFLKFLGIKVVVILTDPTGVFQQTDSWVSIQLKKIDSVIIINILRNFPNIIALSPKLFELTPSAKHKLIFPGILSKKWLNNINRSRLEVKSKKFTVLYAGSITNEYGILELLEAAKRLPQISFHFLGKGNLSARLEECALPNLQYFGFLADNEVVEHMLAADLLVNARSSDLAFSQYSFPSKLIEYLATGRPVLTTKIVSIPEELKRAFFYFENNTIEEIVYQIQRLSNLDPDLLLYRGQLGKNIVVNEYSELAIASKLNKFIEVI